MKYAIRIMGIEFFPDFRKYIELRLNKRDNTITYYMADCFNSSCLLDDPTAAQYHLQFMQDHNPATKLEMIELTDKEAFEKILQGETL